MRFKLIFSFCFSVFIINTNTANGQSTALGQGVKDRLPSPAVPFLTITPDSRAGGMGDVGAATAPDVNDSYWNPSKLAFLNDKMSASISYTPWLQSLGISDMSISYMAFAYKLDKNSTLGANINYFDLGYIEFTDSEGATVGNFYSKELAGGVTYARKLNQNLSVGIGLKLVNSNLTGNQVINGTATKPGRTVAGDISIYRAPKLTGKSLTWAYGASITNLGGKINYGSDDQKYFIPTNFRIGTTASLTKNAQNKFNFSLDLNKLMVPTPPEKDANGVRTRGKDLTEGSALGRIFGSFNDAPDGFKEELKEFTIGAGIEYWYQNQVAFRTGYFHENKDKGGRSYLTAGIGGRFYDIYSFDFAYLFQPTQNGQSSPLNNTLRFSLSARFKGKAKVSDVNLN